MVPIRLIADGVNEQSVRYEFTEGKAYSVGEAEKIKKFLGFVFFGNESVYKGSIEFEFTEDGDTYVIKRDFEKTAVTLKKNARETLSGGEAEAVIADIVKVSEAQWDDTGVIDGKAACEALDGGVKNFVGAQLSVFGANADVLEATIDDYRDEIEEINVKTCALQETIDYDAESFVARAEEIKTALAKLTEEALDTFNLISVGENARVAVEKLAAKKEELGKVVAENAKFEDYAKRLERSENLKKYVTLGETLEKIGKEAEEVKISLGETLAAIEKAEATVRGGEAKRKRCEDAYLYATEKVKALNTALDELIAKNVENGERDEYLLGIAESYYADENRKAEELRKQAEDAEKERTALCEERAEAWSTLDKIRANAEYKRALREGGRIEALIGISCEEKIKIDENYALIEKILAEFKAQIERNKDILAECAAKKEVIFGTLVKGEAKTYNSILRKYNDIERRKQTLYRDQIISATLLQEVNAIDKKVDDNVEVRRGCDENVDALSSAKGTLEGYIAQNENKKNTLEEKLIVLLSEAESYRKVNSVEYGDVCPVCAGVITDRIDVSKKLKAKENEVNAVKAQIAKLDAEIKEYRIKYETVTKRIGELLSQKHNSEAYIASLEKTKTAKLVVLKDVYDALGVGSHTELTRKLEEAIASSAEYAKYLSDLKEAMNKEGIAADNVRTISAQIERIEKSIALHDVEHIDYLASFISENEKEYAPYAGLLGESTAYDSFAVAYEKEKAEDEIVARIQEINVKVDELDKKLFEIRENLVLIKKRDYLVEKNGKQYTYAKLCINVTNEHYEEVIAEIRKEEKNRQAKQDELIAVTKVLQEKQNELNELNRKKDELASKYASDLDYMKLLRESPVYELYKLNEADIESLRSDVLSDEESSAMREELKAHEETAAKLLCEIDALEELTAKDAGAYENLDANKQKAKSINEKIDALNTEFTAVGEKIAVYNAVAARIEKLNRRLAALRRKATEVETLVSVSEETISDTALEDAFVSKTNNFVSTMLSGYRLRIADGGIGGIKVIVTDKKGVEKTLTKYNDEEIAVFGIAATCALKQIEENVLAASLVKIVKIGAYALSDDMARKALETARNNGIIVVFTR